MWAGVGFARTRFLGILYRFSGLGGGHGHNPAVDVAT